jgi:hypothetical protein
VQDKASWPRDLAESPQDKIGALALRAQSRTVKEGYETGINQMGATRPEDLGLGSPRYVVAVRVPPKDTMVSLRIAD